MKKNISKSHSESTGPKLLIQIMKKYDLIFFVAITFIISWFPWYAGLGNEVMTMGPSLAAILVTVILSGRKGLKELFRPFLKIRRLKAFWVLAILGPAVIYLIAIVISLLLGGEIPPFIMIRDEWKLLPLYLFFVVLMPWNGPIGEEIG